MEQKTQPIIRRKSKPKPQRKYFQSDGIRLSYLDFHPEPVEVAKPILLVLHGHFGNARMFSRLGDWHVIGLDQRGHGWSEHVAAHEYSREKYVTDVATFIRKELGTHPVVVLGHSLGGVNAYQLAAWHPELVRALIVEDIGAVVKDDLSFANWLPERASRVSELKRSLLRLGLQGFDYFAESVCEDEDGWYFRFDTKGMAPSQERLNGDWWHDWLASDCPALLIHGEKSRILGREHADEMAGRRPNTKVVHMADCGHEVHDADPDGFYMKVRAFLEEIG
ncbi:alpha/beta fold hydrolase [Brevibacillus dissolubilis]|uniref:alpha/beta fold hydrolase n=1 Tax=Brevibacillus dissolubilis TaxID=1844116 RepID=UPI0011167A64|nr:alpha/beta hydrolase [Brevibacillus dissolubilis]